MYKVLLVDDEILVREAISAKIEWEQIGFELVGDCENGKDAIEFVKEHPVDLVLTDICMPYIDGMGLSRYLYENMPQTKIVIFSGYSDFEYAKQAIQYKVAEYLLKPVTAKELTEVLIRIREKLDSERSEEEKIDVLKKAYRTYTKNEALIISKTLSRLIQGTQAIETSMDELKEFGIELGGAFYRVVTTDIDVYSSLYDTDEELKKESALMSFVVENISHEIVSNHNAGIAYRDSDSRVCMLLWTDTPKEFRQEAREICQEIQEMVRQAMQLSVEDNIKAVLEMSNLPKDYQRHRLEEMLDEFGLQHIRKSKGIQLSGGERRRTEIARALSIAPKFILLDEPFAGVDPIAVEDIQSIVIKLNEKNIGILITDHNVQETLCITDRAYLLYDGRILQSGSAEDLANDPEVRRVYLGKNFELRRKK